MAALSVGLERGQLSLLSLTLLQQRAQRHEADERLFRVCVTEHKEVHVDHPCIITNCPQAREGIETLNVVLHLLASAAYFLKKGSSGVRVMCSRSVPYMRASSRFLATRPAAGGGSTEGFSVSAAARCRTCACLPGLSSPGLQGRGASGGWWEITHDVRPRVTLYAKRSFLLLCRRTQLQVQQLAGHHFLHLPRSFTGPPLQHFLRLL